MRRCSAYQLRSSAGFRVRKKTPPMPSTSSATDELPRSPHELGENVAVRAELLEPCVLPLCGVRVWDSEVRRGADLLRDRQYPLDQRLDPGARGHDLSALEVDQAVAETVPDRAPHVLLDQAMRQVRERLALVESAREAGAKRVHERRERLRLCEVGLRVADADLDRREREMRPNAPPHLRVLVDRARVVEEADVALEAVPAVVCVRDPAAREHLGEDLRPRRVEIRADVLDEGGRGGQREELRS